MARRRDDKGNGVRHCRRRNRLVLFAAEGHNRTETYYLKDFVRDVGGMKLHRSRDASTDPVGMVKGLISTMEDLGFDSREGDLAFCLLDMDCSRDKEKPLQEALRLAKKNEIQKIVSNPCFELWFICHYTSNPRRYASSSELVKDMDRYIKGYAKSLEGIHMLIKNNIESAIRNAENLEKKALASGYCRYCADFSPTTDMYKLVCRMRRK